VGPVVWIMIPEALPLSVRGTAMGVAVFGNWAANFLVSQTFPPLISAFGPGPVFLGYAALGIVAALFLRQYVTETKGRSVEEIEAVTCSAPAADADGALGPIRGAAQRSAERSARGHLFRAQQGLRSCPRRLWPKLRICLRRRLPCR
jgi:MFS family permease